MAEALAAWPAPYIEGVEETKLDIPLTPEETGVFSVTKATRSQITLRVHQEAIDSLRVEEIQRVVQEFLDRIKAQKII